ncbi:MAG: DUF4142 domain-containing protein [Kofleriaceae bacterium]|nr:DUF4142 domain-containing protein [Kofleriaceae bacterium]
MNKITRALVFALLVAPVAASAEQPKAPAADTTQKDTTQKEKPAKLTDTELQVMAHYHGVNQMEIDLGKAASKKAANKDVKAYGDMLVKEHGEADKKLMALAKQTHQTVPAEKPASDVEKQAKAEQKAMATKLKTMKGADFDREYLRMMVQGHEKELAQIDTKKSEVTNAELSAMLDELKPMLQHHEDAAKELQKNEPTATR